MWERLIGIDRRWLFVLIGAAVLTPMVLQLPMPAGRINERTQAVHDYINKAQPGDVIVLAVDYGPASMPEVHPMAVAVTRHALQRDLRVVAMTLNVQGSLLADMALQEAVEVDELRDKEDGVDYVNLGFKPGGSLVVLGMGDSIPRTFVRDARGRPMSELPIMRDVESFDDVHLVMAIESTTAADIWILFARERFDQAVAMGVTAVMATDFYPYLSTGQLVGMINGLKGAAEYETLIEHPDIALLGMTAQSVAHMVIIIFVIMGNIGYFVTRGRRARR